MRIGSVPAGVGRQARKLWAAAAPSASSLLGVPLAMAMLAGPAAAQPGQTPSSEGRPVPASAAQAPSASQPAASPGDERGTLEWSDFRPTSVFLQAGIAEEAEMAIVGATWEWSWYRDFSFGRLGGYWEASIGRWNSDVDDNGGSAWVTQFGVTPVLRLYPDSWGGRWFVEGGIGFNVLQPIYRSASKRFSTAFNFGDHLAIGRRFGRDARQELALRFQHFSNAGIKSPNPGENFVQLRYSLYF
jgi:hypothetical protein